MALSIDSNQIKLQIMEMQKQNQTLKTAVVVLSLLLVGSVFYIFKNSSETQKLVTLVQTTKSEKDKLLQDFEGLKATYDAAIAEKTSMSSELVAERDKVIGLIANLKKSKGDVASVDRYKSKYFELENKMKDLIAENDNLKAQNGTLVAQRDSIQTITIEAKKTNETLVAQNDDLSKTVVKAQKLTVSNLKTVAVKQRSSGKQVDTEKARKADILKVSFTIAENAVATPGDKVYNVQVIDSNNNVLGEKKIENYGEKTLTYSFAKTVNYDNKNIEITEDLPVKDLESGTYFVNVFDNGELVSKTSFALR